MEKEFCLHGYNVYQHASGTGEQLVNFVSPGENYPLYGTVLEIQ